MVNSVNKSVRNEKVCGREGRREGGKREGGLALPSDCSGSRGGRVQGSEKAESHFSSVKS